MRMRWTGSRGHLYLSQGMLVSLRMQRLRSDVRLLLHRSGASNLRQRLLLHLRLEGSLR
jgi:hypothetical protein